MPRKSKADAWLTPDGLLRVKGWARDGLTDEQISDKIGISRDTFYRWEREFSDFSDAVKEGKAPVDIEVENALLKSALGHTVKVRKPIKVRTKRQLKDKGTIEEEAIEYVDEEVYIPPQTSAQIFWLKNRRPDKWRDKPVDMAISEENNAADDALTAALKEDAAKLEAGDADAAE